MRPTAVLVTLLLTLGGAAVAAAQQDSPAANLDLLVVDDDGNPVAGATVLLLGPSHSLLRDVATDAEGRVLLEDLLPQTYEIRVHATKVGAVERVIQVRRGDNRLELALDPTAIEERVTVTATRGVLREESEVAAQVRSLDEEILQSRAVDLLPRMLDEEPGVQVQQTTPGQGSPLLRGQSANAVLYLLDGIRYNNATYRGGNTQYLAWIPDVSVGSVEIFLGPAGVNYGSDALGGAVNVMTRPLPGHPDERWRFHGSARAFGEFGSLGAGSSLTLGGASPRFAGFVAGSGARHQDIRTGGGDDSHSALVRFLGFDQEQVEAVIGDRLPDTGYSRASISAKAGWRLGPTSSLNAYYTRSDQFDVQRYDRLLGGDGRLTAAFTPQRLEFGYLRFQRIFSETFVESTVSVNRQLDGRRDQRSPLRDLRVESNEVTSLGLETTASRRLDDHLLSFGAEVYDEHVDTFRTEQPPGGVARRVRPRFPDGSRYTTVGAFLLDEWSTLENRLQITAGARFSFFRFDADAADNLIDGEPVVPDSTQTFDDVTFNAGANFAVTNTVGVWGRVARGFRAPSVNDLGEEGLTGGGFEVAPDEAVAIGARVGDSSGPDAVSLGIGWASLEPEYLWSFEGGIRWQDDGLRLEVAAFDSELFASISRRAVIVDRPVVGETIGGETIIAQDAAGRIFVARDPDPVVSRFNIGRVRVWGLEMLAQKAWGRGWLATLKGNWQRSTELDTGLPLRRSVPATGTASLRWRSRENRLWLEGVVRGTVTQDRLNPGDIQDARIGGFRDAGDIQEFFTVDGPRLGLVEDGILLATGETLDEVIARVLGPDAETGAPLFTETPGWVRLGIRGGYRIAEGHTLTFALDNLTDLNYRLHGSGFDALGINLSLSYNVDF